MGIANAKSSREMEPGAGNDGSKLQSADHEPDTVQAQNYAAKDLKGRPVDKSRSGTWKAAPFIFAINLADFQTGVGIAINLVPYLSATMHQSIAKSVNITTDFLGTFYLVSILGGFLADSYLGSFYTICVGGITVLLGMGLLTASAGLSTLQPAPCAPLPAVCNPAGSRYMAPLYVALYTVAFGTGLVKPNTVALGGDQFDDMDPAEKKQSVRFFTWFYFAFNIGLIFACSLGVYLQDDVSRSWGYGFSLMLYGVCFLFFVLGVPKFRHITPTGSFLTRAAQVLVASLRKWKAPAPASTQELYNPGPTARLNFKLSHTPKLRILDRAATIDEADKEAIARGQPDPWRLCSVTQVEESKRLIQLVPVCLTTTSVTIVFSQLSTFVVQQGSSLDRNLGPHFTIPPAALTTITIISALVCTPMYDKFIFPLARRITKCPYGFAPLQRLGASLVFACLSMIVGALVERKRLTYVRDLNLQHNPLGADVLPMKFWYLVPQLFLGAPVEFFLYVSSFEFFYHESAGSTRRVASSYTYTASSMGYFFSTILVKITNHVTRNDKGGAWLKTDGLINGQKGQINNGGLEKFYWLLAVFIGVNFVFYLMAAHFYEYKFDWYSIKSEREASLARNQVDNVEDSG